MATSDILVGKWTYRSFHNRAAMVDGVADAALKLIFAEATFTFTLSDSTTLEGAIDWDGGGLDISGTVAPATATSPLSVALLGSGRRSAPIRTMARQRAMSRPSLRSSNSDEIRAIARGREAGGRHSPR